MKPHPWRGPLVLAALAALAAVLYLVARTGPHAPSPAGIAPTAIDCADPDFAWQAHTGVGGDDALVRGGRVDRIRGDLNALVQVLNRSADAPDRLLARDPGIERPIFQLSHVQGDSVHVKVLNPERLASRLGSTGAQAALAEATYLLTEHPGIRNVNFLFPEGDHAEPGTYSRSDFAGSWKIVQGP